MMTWAPSKAFDRLIEALERHGSRVEGDGRQRKAQCPSHSDRDPSLSVTDGEARVLAKCHAGCDTDDVLAQLGLTRADLFDQPRERQPRRQVIAEYKYVNESCELLFVKERLEPKFFRVKRPDGHGWAWGLTPETPRVLYRLPQILAAPPSAAIFIAEGEKDVHALEAVGEIATCNFDGASGAGDRPKWRAEYAPVLAGRDVLIIADRDDEGRAHARYIAACLDRVARFAWIVEAGIGKDAADHLGAGRAVTEFTWWDR